ncbi:2Fe-2S iron-sulfur cluster-binding protein [Ramlibacter sp.]|uniref:2Fe-2S iron-sulfur cluster-binding protein n=1 Tax=Ramlibacter sp. TaxID=1917967 RepID=UPI002FCB6BA1
MDALVEIRGARGTQSFRCARGERLLYAGLRAGANLAYGCATGTCGNCKATLLAGSVEPAWNDAPGRRALRKPGEILLCQSTPHSDCVLEARDGSCNHPRELAQSYQGHVSSVDRDEDGLAWVVLKLQRPMRFHAGQFVLVAAPGVQGFRAYSPAHDGADVSRLALVVREKEGGGMSPLLCSGRGMGMPVTVFGPLGTAHVHPAEDRDIAVLAGGSGAGVALSLLDWATASGHLARNRMDIVCGLRTLGSRQVIGRLEAAAEAAPGRVRIVVALSEPSGPEPNEQPGLRFEQGLAHVVASRALPVDEWKRRAVFVAGPAPMVEASLRMLMLTAKLSPTKIRYDSFS